VTGPVPGLEPAVWRLELEPGAPARELAIQLLNLPPSQLLPSRIDRLARAICPGYRPGACRGRPLPGGYQLSGWLWWIGAPGRVVLEVDLGELAVAGRRET
jgi:hypothetical protein